MRIGFRTSPQKTDRANLEAAWAEAGQHDVRQLATEVAAPIRDAFG
jgi:hypothetical protein